MRGFSPHASIAAHFVARRLETKLWITSDRHFVLLTQKAELVEKSDCAFL